MSGRGGAGFGLDSELGGASTEPRRNSGSRSGALPSIGSALPALGSKGQGPPTGALQPPGRPQAFGLDAESPATLHSTTPELPAPAAPSALGQLKPLKPPTAAGAGLPPRTTTATDPDPVIAAPRDALGTTRQASLASPRGDSSSASLAARDPPQLTRGQSPPSSQRPPSRALPQQQFGLDAEGGPQHAVYSAMAGGASPQLQPSPPAVPLIRTAAPRPNMSEDQAALKIQSGYRGFQARKQVAASTGRQLVPAGAGAGRPDARRRMDTAAGHAPPLVMGPVIDISRLPRYGLLAPPLPRQPRIAGKLVAYDRATGVFSRNRGLLREALENKSGWLEEAALRLWAEFARRQLKRHVRVPPDPSRRTLPETQGYRLRILRVNDLPVHTTADGRTFEFQLGVSLYDEALGLFYGNTIYSQSDGYDKGRAAQRNAVDLDFSFDVFYHTQVSDPRCMAVAEVIMVERGSDGVVGGRYALGWALLPLFRMVAAVPVGAVGPEAGVQPLVVPLVAGTARYLLMRSVHTEDLRAPKVLQSCSIAFQAEVYPAGDAFIPLLPQDFLVTYGDVLPGLRRFDAAGQLSVTTKSAISTLAHPMLCPTHSIVLRRLQLALPHKLHELLTSLDPRKTVPHIDGSVVAGTQLLPPGAQPLEPSSGQLRYSVRVGVHNGRTFVGPCYELAHLTSMDVPGWKVLQVPAPDAVFDYMMGDVMCACVLELVATPAQHVPPGAAPVQFLVGWTACVPFAFISDDGNHAEVAVGVHRYALNSGPRGLSLRAQPPLNWRAMLGDAIIRDIPDPMVEFQLFETGRTPIPPPLRCRFAAIEAQRADEAALGERTLEEVMAPVPVPQDLVPPPNLMLQPPRQDPMDLIRASQPVLLAHGTQTSQDGRLSPRPPSEPRAEPPRVQSPPRSPPRDPSPPRAQDTAERDQLREVTAAMGRQIQLLTQAVDELKEERKTLRSSLMSVVDRPTVVHVQSPSPPPAPPPAARPSPPPAAPYSPPVTSPAPMLASGAQSGRVAPPEDIRRLMEMEPTSQFGAPAAFAGAAAPVYGGLGVGTAPSRVLLQQLYDAGMVDALPDDVQALMRARGGLGAPAAMPGLTLDLSIEARDSRIASDFIIQFLAFRHHDTLNAPAALQSAYFTFQFFHFPPTTTDMAYLVEPHPSPAAPITRGMPGTYPAGSPTRHGGAAEHDALAATRILVTNQPLQKGAGVVFKFVLDGSADPLGPGQTPASAAFEAHMGLASYLATKNLSVDMWDGDSLLQVGTAVIELAALLRQGRPYAEQLVEVPFMMMDALGGGQGGPPPTGPGTALQAMTDLRAAPALLSRGSVVVRLINIGREPSVKGPGTAGTDGGPQQGAIKRTRVRVKPAWERVDSPIARELANGDHPDVQGVQDQPGDQHPNSPAAATSHLRPARQQPFGNTHVAGLPASDTKAALVKAAILERSSRKSSRARQLRNILDADPDPARAAAQAAQQAQAPEGAFVGVQRQLLVDVASARARNKDAYIREQLRKNMVFSQVVRPGYGEVIVYEHELFNPYSHETVFELRISSPQEVSVLSRPDDVRALRAAGARFLGSPAQSAALQEGELLAGNRIYLQPGERVTLPLKVQSLSPPHGYGSAASTAPLTQAPGGPPRPTNHPARRERSPGAPAQGPTARQAPPPGLGHPRRLYGPIQDAGPAGDGEGGHPAPGPGPEGNKVHVQVINTSSGLPVGILELDIRPKPLIIDRTFRFYHAEHDVMRQTVRLRALPGGETAFSSGVLRNLATAASHPDVITGAGGAGLAAGAPERDEVYIKLKCGAAPEVTHFYVLLYADRLLSRPIEVWQVFVHALRKVDMRAQVGQAANVSVVVRGAASSRRVAVYSSHPDELQGTPSSFVLVAGALTELLLTFKPAIPGAKDIKVHLVDVETRELVYALVVAAEAQGPLVTRTFEMELPAGAVANKKISYTNPYQAFRNFSLRCDAPWLLTFTPPRLALPAGATRPLGLTFDARAATPGVIDVLVFVNDEEERTEECFRVRVRIYR